MAPEAQLYALKVFGCHGSTALLTQAIERTVDPNGDGNPADHLDVLIISVGTPFGSESSPDWAVWICSTGNAMASSTAAAAVAEIAGCLSAGVRIADQKRFSPLWRRSRCRYGIRPFSMRSPSFASSAGSTVSEQLTGLVDNRYPLRLQAVDGGGDHVADRPDLGGVEAAAHPHDDRGRRFGRLA